MKTNDAVAGLNWYPGSRFLHDPPGAAVHFAPRGVNFLLKPTAAGSFGHFHDAFLCEKLFIKR